MPAGIASPVGPSRTIDGVGVHARGEGGGGGCRILSDSSPESRSLMEGERHHTRPGRRGVVQVGESRILPVYRDAVAVISLRVGWQRVLEIRGHRQDQKSGRRTDDKKGKRLRGGPATAVPGRCAVVVQSRDPCPVTEGDGYDPRAAYSSCFGRVSPASSARPFCRPFGGSASEG